jgi:hypothetical protein
MPADTRKKMSGWFWFALYSSLRLSMFPDCDSRAPTVHVPNPSTRAAASLPGEVTMPWPAIGGKEGEKGESTSARPYLCCYRAHSMPMHPPADL